MGRLSKILLVFVLSFCLLDFAHAEEGGLSFWKSRVKGMIAKAKVEAKKIEVKIKDWASSFIDNDKKEEAKPVAAAPASPSSATDRKVASAPTTPAETSPKAPAESIIESQQPSTAKELADIAKEFKANKLLTAEAPAREGDKTLKRNKQGIVVIPNISKKIPRLDIGDEEKLSYKDIIGDKTQFKPIVVKPFSPRSSPALTDSKKTLALIPNVIEKVLNARDVVSTIKSEDFPVTKEKIDAVTYALNQPKIFEELVVKPLTHNELLLVASYLINGDGKSCHTLVGLLRDMKEGQSHLAESKFLSASCLKEMGLYNQFLEDLKSVMNLSDGEYGKLALAAMSDSVKYNFEQDIAQVVRDNSGKYELTDKTRDQIQFLYAKVAARDGDSKGTVEAAKKIAVGSPYYARAQFLLMTAELLLGENKESLTVGKSLLEYLTKKGDPEKLEPLIHMNMARAYYNTKSYTDANQAFLKVKKDHAQWIPSLIEQGWAQIQSQDYAGAIGNMFSIQTNLFTNVYKPESYIVRTIGYLNLCQYGDAHHSLALFDKIHYMWAGKINEYMTWHKANKDYYETVKRHLQTPAQPTVDGLPSQIVREMARHKDFLNTQVGVNELIDEVEQWAFVEKFFSKDVARITSKLQQLRASEKAIASRIAFAQKNKVPANEIAESAADLKRVQQHQANLQFKFDMIKKAQDGFKSLKKEGVTKVIAKKDSLRSKAEKILVKRLKVIKEEIDEIIANNELLKYEVFSGSGENIRFQVAGGQKGEARKPNHVKDNSKNMKWEFDGEIWEDEIGNFRSTLENNCPKEKSKNASL